MKLVEVPFSIGYVADQVDQSEERAKGWAHHQRD